MQTLGIFASIDFKSSQAFINYIFLYTRFCAQRTEEAKSCC